MSAGERKASLWMLGGSLAFTVMAACIKLSSQHGATVFEVPFIRGLVAVILLAPYLMLKRIGLWSPHWKAHLRRGVIGFAGMITYVIAIAALPLSAAVTLNYTSPVILALMLHFGYREPPSLRFILSISGGLLGILLLLRPTYAASQWPGAVAGLLSALFAAISALNIRTLGRLDEPAGRTALYFSICVTLGCLPAVVKPDILHLNTEALLYAILAGAMATLGQVWLSMAYQRGHTMLVSLLGYSQVVFSSLLGLGLWGDRLTWMAWVGMALIIASGIAALVSHPRTSQVAASDAI